VRRFLILAAALSALVPATAEAVVVNHRVDAGHTGEIRDAKLSSPIGRKWFRTDISAQDALVADGRVFLSASDPSNTSGAPSRSVIALERDTGRTVWERPGLAIGFAYAEGVLFYTTDKALVAVAAADGTPRWTLDLSGEPGIPTYDGGTLYVGVEDAVVAVRASDGFELWSRGASGASEGALGVDAERVYAVSGCTETTALERRLGLQVWRHVGDCTGGGGATPLVADGLVYAPDTREGAILEASSGNLRGTAIGYPTRAGDRVILTQRKDLVAQDREGRTVWRVTRPDGGSTPLVVGGIAWSSEESSLAGYDTGTGALVQRIDAVGHANSYNWAPDLASDGEWLISAGRRVVGLAAGADTPAPDDPPPPPGPPQLNVFLSAEDRVYTAGGSPIELLASVKPFVDIADRSIHLQIDPYPFDGRWEDHGRIGGVEREVVPRVNTRYRAVDRTTEQPAASEPVEVRVEFGTDLDIEAITRRTARATAELWAPQGLAMAQRPVFFYKLRRGQKLGTRIRKVRWRATARRGRFTASIRLARKGLRRIDKIFFCFRNPAPNAIGKPVRGPDPCGRRRA
jgi:outer membrane protein assembly factor BamB